METKIKALALLLGLQVAVAIGLGLNGNGVSGPLKPGPMLALQPEQVDRITVEDADHGKVVLARNGNNWQLPEADNFPADRQRVERLLEKLADLKAGAPVASSAEARQRFKVSDAAFERKVNLAADGNTLATLYLGTSPGVRRVHARSAAEDAVHEVELAVHDAPADSASWQDKTVLQFPQDELTQLEVAGLKITSQPKSEQTGNSKGAPEADAWITSGLPAGEQLDTEAVEKLAAKLAELRFREMLGREAKPEWGLEKPLLALTVTRKDGEAVRYVIGKTGDAAEYTLKVSTRPEYFRLPAYTATALVDAAKRDALVRQTDQNQPPESSSPKG